MDDDVVETQPPKPLIVKYALNGIIAYASQLETLVLANNILHYHNVVDAYGHVSLRHPEKPDVFIMSGDKAPALVSSQSDLIPYYVSNASAGKMVVPNHSPSHDCFPLRGNLPRP